MIRFHFYIIALVLGMLAFVPTVSSAATACCDGLCVSDLAGQIKDAQATLKQTQVEYVKSDMKDFCQRNLMLRFLNANGARPDEPYAMPISKLEKLVDNLSHKIGSQDPWDSSLKSTENTRNASLSQALTSLKSNGEPILGNNVRDNQTLLNDFGKFISESKPATPAQIESTLNAFKNNKKTKIEDIEYGSKKSQVLKTAACLEISVFKSGDCVRALNILQEEMSPVRMRGIGSSLVDSNLWKRVLDNNKYDEGIRLASLKLIDRLKNKDIDKANIFDDLKTSFSKSGLNSKDSEEGAWDVLAMISSGGPNTLGRFRELEKETSQRGLGISFIAAALGSLDYMKMKSGQGMYSYPSNVQTNCDNAKPYHFWMASHMARTLVKDHGFSPETAEQATFIAMKGYQLKRLAVAGVDDESEGQKLIESANYSPVQQVIRTDLAFAAAGAVNGANSGQKNINADRIIQTLMTDSNDIKSESKSGPPGLVETYLRFRGVYSPNSALEAAGK
jgi:hypothetical protein